MTPSEAAFQYIGVPFKHMGRTSAGLDCAGLILMTAADCGYIAESTPVYGHEPRDGHMLKTLLAHGCKVVDRAPRVDDIVVTSLRDGGPSVHVGIVTDHPNGLGIIHTYGLIGRVVHQRLDDNKLRNVTEVLEWPEKH